MKTSELKSKLADMGLTVNGPRADINSYVDIYNQRGIMIAQVSTTIGGRMSTYRESLDLSSADQHQLIDYVMDYAQTPVDDRKDEKLWNVVISGEPSIKAVTAWYKYGDDFRLDGGTTPSDLASDDYRFTDSEFEKLCEALMTVPYGPTYVRIAELGKREAQHDTRTD